MNKEEPKIKIHVLHCGSITVSPRVPFGGGATMRNAVHGVFDRESRRVTLPCSVYLIEHPKGLVLVDTGWSRSISPHGVYEPKAVKTELPAYLASFYRPVVEHGKTAAEQLHKMGIEPEDIDVLMISHLDADHICALRDFKNAKRILMPEEEYWWSARLVYSLREPKHMWFDIMPEKFWYKGTPHGPLNWSYDLFDDDTLRFVCLPGHTDGMCALKVKRDKKFVILASDAAFSKKSWEEGIVPGFGFNDVQARRSLEWLKSQSEDPDCLAILANHDPEVKPQLIEL